MLQAVPYHPDSARLFTAVADQPWSVFLDSGKPNSIQGRYDVIATDPVSTIVTINGITKVSGPDGVFESQDNPIKLIRGLLGKNHETGIARS